MNKKLIKRVAVVSLAALMTIPDLIMNTNAMTAVEVVADGMLLTRP